MDLRTLVQTRAMKVADRAARDRDTAVVFLRGDLLDEDTLSFGLNFGELGSPARLCLVASSTEGLRAANGQYLAAVEDTVGEVASVAADGPDLRAELLRARLVVLPSFKDGWPLRLGLSSQDRLIVRTYHGIITKGYGNLKPDGNGRPEQEFGRGIDVRSVASDVELHFRSSAEGAHPGAYRKWGYPRYDRIYDLIDGRAAPLLMPASEELLKGSGRRNVLYAPTHKDRAYGTTLFPFPDFDADALRDTLRRHDLNLFLRMHMIEEGAENTGGLIDGDRIHNGGRSLSTSVVEALPSIDLVITDYSSIYMNYLPFDRPVLFLDDDRESFDRIRGLAFDYDRYFPGPKVTSFRGFLRELDVVFGEGTDTHAVERAFVSKVFIPDREMRFMTHLRTALEHRRPSA